MHVRGVFLLASLGFLAVGRASATEELRIEVALAAENLKKFLDGRGKKSIAIGVFRGPPEASGGLLIAKTLMEELPKHDVKIDLLAPLIVQGSYWPVTDKTSKLLAGRLAFQVITRKDEEELAFERGVFGKATLPIIFGTTARFTPTGNPKTFSDEMAQATDKPQVHIDDTRISAPASPYAIEILVKQSGRLAARIPQLKNGLAFVPIARDEVYAVKLLNNSAHEAAVTLSIDGLNFFSFSDIKDATTRQPFYSVVLVPAKGELTVTGWHRTNKHADEFLVTEYAKSAAAELKSASNVGTITASFAAAWPKDAKGPDDEPPTSRSIDATGRGKQVDTDFMEVVRHVGVIRDTVSVRYAK